MLSARSFFLSCIVLSALICPVSAKDAGDTTVTESKILKPGTVAPSFNLPDLTGTRTSLSTWCGPVLSKPFVNKTKHIVILSFWATYCVPCAVEIPLLEKFMTAHSGEPIKALLISIDEQGSELVNPFVKKFNYGLPVLLDPYRKTAERFGVTGLPSLFIIDTAGVIRYSSFGYDKKTDLAQLLENKIREIRETVSATDR